MRRYKSTYRIGGKRYRVARVHKSKSFAVGRRQRIHSQGYHARVIRRGGKYAILRGPRLRKR